MIHAQASPRPHLKITAKNCRQQKSLCPIFCCLLFWLCASFLFLNPQNASAHETVSLDEMLGAMIMCGFREAELTEDSDILKQIASGRLGHVILFDRDVTTGKKRNILSRPQVRALTQTLRAHAAHPILIAVDQEGGRVRRFKEQMGFPPLPAPAEMGHASPKTTEALARATGQELHTLGINVDFAPVADLDGSRHGHRSRLAAQMRTFGAQAETVTAHALAFGQGLFQSGVLPTLKHFPGLGCAEQDTHQERADIAACFRREQDLVPFRTAIAQSWPGLIMVSHANLDPEYPATLSKAVVTDLLRGELGWQGVVISDDLQMQAIRRYFSLEESIRLAVSAGVDILLFGNNLVWEEDLPRRAHAALKHLVTTGVLSKERIETSWRRIQELFKYLDRPASNLR